MSQAKIIVTDGNLRVIDLEVPRRDVADYFSKLEEDERIPAMLQVLEVGVFCLERASTSLDTDFVRRQVESLLSRVETEIGSLPDKTRDAIVAKIGTADGQVLAPVKAIVDSATGVAKDRLNEVKTLLTEEIDPRQEASTLGKALRTLTQLLDEKHADSIQSKLSSAVTTVVARDGELATAVREEVKGALAPLAKEVADLAMEVRGKSAAEEALSQTTEKGASYELEVVGALQDWARITGAEVSHVGADNQPGDVLVSFSEDSIVGAQLRIVVEAKDTQSLMGRKRVCDSLDAAMAHRDADAAVFLSRTQAGLAQDVGEWSDGVRERGSYVACTDQHLITAVRFLITQKRLACVKVGAPEVDVAAVRGHMQRAQAALAHVMNINTYASKVRSNSDNIEKEARAIRDEVGDALAAAEIALRSGGATQ